METYSRNYYSHKLITLFFALIFLSGFIKGLLDPEDFWIRYGDKSVEINIMNLLPILIIGLLASILFVLMILKYFRIKMDEEGITILKFGNNIKYNWSDIENITEISWIAKDTIFRVKPKIGKPFFFYTDRPNNTRVDTSIFRARTEMAEFLKRNNRLKV